MSFRAATVDFFSRNIGVSSRKNMFVYHTNNYPIVISEKHNFPNTKYQDLYQRVRDKLGAYIELVEAPAASIDDLCNAHESTYVDKVLNGCFSRKEERELGLPWTQSLVIRAKHSVGGTVAALSRAIGYEGIAVNLGGGAHHAKSARAAGFCLFNDVAVAALKIHNERPLDRILVVDCDVHQGDGTAEILDSYPTIFTFSIHATRNYPSKKIASDFDISLPDETSNETYLTRLKEALSDVIDNFNPNFLIYVAGADVYKDDRLGRWRLSKNTISSRDHLVLDLASKKTIPIAIVMGGGYSKNIADTIDIHLQTVSNAHDYIDRYS